jgi:hypothetical protein
MEVASEYIQHPLTVIIIQCEHKTPLHFQNDTGYMQHTYFTLTPADRKKTQRFVSNDQGDCCCCCPPLLDATNFENGYNTTEELVCSPVSI